MLLSGSCLSSERQNIELLFLLLELKVTLAFATSIGLGQSASNFISQFSKQTFDFLKGKI
jgi:hypothetical protein